MTWQLRVSWYPFALYRNLSNMIIIITTTVIDNSEFAYTCIRAELHTNDQSLLPKKCNASLILFDSPGIPWHAVQDS